LYYNIKHLIIHLFIFRIHLEGEGDLVIENVSDEDEGKYQCLAKNIVGTRSTEKAELQVQGNHNF